MKNGFFQLIHKVDGTYMKLIPPEDGGEKLSMKELMAFLNERGIDFDVTALNKELAELDSEKIIWLSSMNFHPFRESYSLRVTEDRMMAVVRFYAPSLGAEEMTPEELMADLRAKKIRSGICSQNIMDYFQDRAYCTDVVVAQGRPYQVGQDAEIEYMFPTERKAKPMLREDGSVDFHVLNMICPCKEGDLLARLKPAVPGKSGMNVYGEELKAPPVNEEKLKYGRHIGLSEDKLEIHSQINGNVALIGGEVFVSELLELENVDVSTGNIDYDGGIRINGNIFSGYSVRATGDIEVKGVVEGALVESGGNISIARGMNGMSKGTLTAKGNIISKFLENVEVSAGGFVVTEAILHSKVRAGTEIQVTGKKGFIVGGHVAASNKISVKTLGSHMGASTIVEVGVNPELKKRQAELLKEMHELRKTLAGIEPILTAALQKKRNHIPMSQEQLKNIGQLVEARQEKKERLIRISTELEDMDEILAESGNPVVEVEDEVYPGTKICILDVSMMVKGVTKFCRFVREAGDVKMMALS